ncbi:MAG: ATPase [Bdellovibrionales bacterium RIFOXYB1_FULL_37_110]|nr:MAG: ATPase [Bdellovibrionales bacterium RIFOXYC1_FULL_37_79]OFZ52991.1 MAG: ATPase [Bdellovibrionales bacterium RIFOXYB2_FULL_36_6]OFZ58263.1 MAG: ATPase [Bdellovibrionales bacterium RIFOXYB1_FULL_37_110]OFZ62316.1 MAG: ATPase [Bdellovibrionales bacterium RIFOXYD1_FULL_36_51]
MKRYLFESIKNDLGKKLVFISGPRQSGKTTLSKMFENKCNYLNFDNDDDRRIILKKRWDRSSDLLILDELHKMNKWKGWLKGVYDVEGMHPPIIVTGSSKLDTYRKVGDSLAGRFFSYRLHPLDIKEIMKYLPEISSKDALERLFATGPFPEPFLNGTQEYYRRWRKGYQDIIIKQDLITLENVRNITGIENLLLLMRERVGATCSYTNIARDLEVDPKTVMKWLDILERLFIVFKVTPYSKKIRDSLLKAPKYYFYDTAMVSGDSGTKLENLVACALLKELHYLEDTKGLDINLHYIRNKRGEEIDFCVLIDRMPKLLCEVKWSDDNFAKAFNSYAKYFPNIKKVQLVANLPREITLDRLSEIRNAATWLGDFQLM